MLHPGLRIATHLPLSLLPSSMGVIWWMKASLKLILISPCLFIMAPGVTPARCMKCPASCHPCPLPLYLCNLFLLPSLSLSPSFCVHSLSSTPFYLLRSFRRHKCLLSPYKCDVLPEPRRGCVLFPFSESIMFTGLLVASLFSQRYSSSLSSSSQKVVRESLRSGECCQVNLFVWIYTKKAISPAMWAYWPCHVKSNCNKKADSWHLWWQFHYWFPTLFAPSRQIDFHCKVLT